MRRGWMRGLAAVLLAAAMYLAQPTAAQAAIEQEVVYDDGWVRNRISSFSGEVPQSIEALLDAHGFADAVCVAGAALDGEMVNPSAGEMRLPCCALLVMRREDAHTLVGLRWISGNQSVCAEDFGKLGLPLEQDCAIRPLWDENRIGVEFELRLSGAEGETCLRLAAHAMDGWYLLAHTAPDGTEAVFTPDGCVEINGERFDAPVRTWLAELTRLDDLPLTAPQAQRLAQAYLRTAEEKDLCLIWGANLRAEPTGHSSSLGRYHAAPARVLGKEAGRDQPWYYVQAGDTKGYISGRYLTFASDEGRYWERSRIPCPVAVAEAGSLLMRSRESGEALCALEPQQRLRVLGETEDGWLHVFVPEGDLSWALDQPGIFGYLHRDRIRLWLGAATYDE